MTKPLLPSRILSTVYVSKTVSIIMHPSYEGYCDKNRIFLKIRDVYNDIYEKILLNIAATPVCRLIFVRLELQIERDQNQQSGRLQAGGANKFLQ